MKYRRLPGTEIDVSTIGFGCWAIVGDSTWGAQDEQEAIDGLKAAVDAGITFFDTAEAYGQGYSEQLVGKALNDRRDKLVIASKVSPSHFRPDELRAACDRSLANLGMDVIDLYQLHWPNRDIPVAETFGVCEELKQAGKIRAYGVSNYGPWDLSACEEAGCPVSTNQVAYNLLFRAVEYEIQPVMARMGVGMLCYSPLMQGLLSGKFEHADAVPAGRARSRHFSSAREGTRHGEPGAEVETFDAIRAVRRIADTAGISMANLSLAWLLTRETVTSVICGARNPGQAKRNTEAAGISLSPDILRQLDEVTAHLKDVLGPNADMWMGSGNGARIR